MRDALRTVAVVFGVVVLVVRIGAKVVVGITKQVIGK